MAELNEQQLLLLNSLLYLDDTIKPGMLVADIISDVDIENITYGGGMKEQDVKNLLKEIAADDTLMNLEVSHFTDGEIRGACFVDPNTESATLAFRGTGPLYAAWDDNCQGGYMSDTDMQQQALEFAQKVAKDYDNITVTGHSKGGNMAQYLTVVMGDEIDRCVSYDGQGFGDEFLEKYEKEIAANKNKIRSVCAYNDYVNVLLTSIAGETVYLDNDKFVFPGGHFVYALYESNKDGLDKNGEYVQSKKQSLVIRLLDKAVEEITKAVDKLGVDDPQAEFLIYSLAGMLMGGLVADDGKSLPEIIYQFLKNIDEYIDNLNETDIQKITSGKQDVSFRFAVNTVVLQSFSQTLIDASGLIEEYRGRIESLKRRMANNVIKDLALGIPLSRVINQLEDEIRKLSRLGTTLGDCAELYEKTEVEARAIAE